MDPSVPPPFPPPPPRRRGWWERHWKWAVSLGTLAVLCGIAGMFGLIFFGVFRLLQSSDPYQKAVAVAVADPAVQSALGTPIKPRFYTWGQINISGTSGQASLEIPIAGPKGKGVVYVEATRERGQWYYSNLWVRIGGTNTLHLKP